jgi:pimeloyl-ACP methyl ester carboxylesterase
MRADHGHSTKDPKTLPSSYTDNFWSSDDGLKLYARVYPGPEASAQAVLCLHGLTRNSRDFEELAPHLQRHYRVIVPDVRGRGLSARDPNPQNFSRRSTFRTSSL